MVRRFITVMTSSAIQNLNKNYNCVMPTLCMDKDDSDKVFPHIYRVRKTGEVWTDKEPRAIK